MADDHTLFRKGLRTIVEGFEGLEVVGEASNGVEAVEQARTAIPDVILMDINMPELDGIEATRIILKENPHIGVIIVTMYDDVESVFRAMRAGARGYVLKEADPEEVLRAVDAAGRGEFILCPIIAEKLLEYFSSGIDARQDPISFGELTARESQVLQTAADGLSNKEIANKLQISDKTVKNHIANIFSKLQVNDRTQAIVLAIKKGLVNI